MRKFSMVLAVALLFLGLMISTALGDTLLTTSTPDGGSSGSLAADFWYAGQFTLPQAAHIADIEGYLKRTGSNQSFSAYLYEDNSGRPGTEITNYLITVSSSADPGWCGSSGLDVPLAAGTYWIGFQPSSTENFLGRIYTGVSTLGARAFWYTGGSTDWTVFTDDTSYTIGYRVLGTYDAVPLPASAWLLGSGLLALGGLRRKLKR
jgi:hypothetical protein